MKIHNPIREACVEVLYAVFVEDRYAEKLVEHDLKSKRKWGSRDRRQYAEIVYDMVRWWRWIAFLANIPENQLPSQSNKIDKEKNILHIQAMIDFYFDWRENPKKWAEAATQVPRDVRLSISKELDNLGISELPQIWPDLMDKLNEQAPQFLRVNTLKTSRTELLEQLRTEQISAAVVSGVETAIQLSERKNVFSTQAFKNGWFEMQDGGSQLVAPFLQVEPGQRVVDACAGAGGKTLHLAALMKNKGQVIALDTQPLKLNQLKIRARRASVHIIETREITSHKIIKRLHDSADRLLLDVPCSGLGVLRRHPDTKWKLSAMELERLIQLQKEILTQYTPIVKVDGKVVYATCSILPSENQKQVHNFILSSKGQFELEDELLVSPIETQFDGFYAARFRRMKM